MSLTVRAAIGSFAVLLTDYRAGDTTMTMVNGSDGIWAGASGGSPGYLVLQGPGPFANRAVYSCTGSSGGVLSGITLVEGRDQYFPAGSTLTLTTAPGGGGGGSGSVTSTSVVSANGFTGTVATATSTPAITLSTSITGLLKGTGTALATAGASDLPSTGLVIKQSYSTITIVTAASNIFTCDLSLSNWFQCTLGATNTIAVSNPTTGQQFTIRVVQDGTGDRTVTWFGGITWIGGGEPTLSTDADAVDVLVFKITGAGAYDGFSTVGGTGTVTDLSIVTANGVSGSVATSTTTPAVTLTLGAITPTSIGSATTATTQSAADNSTKIATTAYVDAAVGAAGGGTVTTVSVATANGVSGTVATATTTPAITLTLGAITPTSIGSATTATTQSPGDNTTKLATTAFVTAAAAAAVTAATQTITLTGNVTGSGTGSFAATIATSVALAGSPTTTTQTGSDSSTKIATTAFVAACTTISASNITTGTLPAGQLPNPSASTLGGVQSKAAVSNQFLTSISTSGVPASAQPAFTDISGVATVAQLPTVGLVINQHIGTITTVTAASNIFTCDLSLKDWFSCTLGATNTIALSNATTGQQFTIIIIQDGTGSKTVTWFTTVKWAGGAAPTLTTAANGIDVFTFKCTGTNTYYGFVAGQALA